MAVSHGVDERGESGARVCEAGEGLGVEEDLLLHHDGAEQGEDVPDAELVEEECNSAASDGDGGVERRLDHLPIGGTQTELDLRKSCVNLL